LSHPVSLGVEGPCAPSAERPAFLAAVRELGADFLVCQCLPEMTTEAARKSAWISAGLSSAPESLSGFAAECRAAGLGFILNQEITNYSVEGIFLDRAGRDVLAHPDGVHRWDLAGDELAAAARLSEFAGVLYDEAEHGQMRRETNTNGGNDGSRSGRVHPYWARTDGLTLEQAYEAVYGSARAVADGYRRAGTRIFTEHVFPVMFHTLARAGITACTKFMKEGIDPVYAACALGAAKQYGTGFCVTPDMWGLGCFGFAQVGFPGHSPEELRAALLFAYWMGAERIFVENILADFLSTPGGLLDRSGEGPSARFEPSEYGKVYRWFAREYLPAHPRPYDWREVRPEVGIVRFDDSCWGQANSWLPDALYGASNLKTTPATAAWFGLWHVLTHGKVHTDGLSYHTKSYRQTQPQPATAGADGSPYAAGHTPSGVVRHDFFCPLRGVAVYDHLAGPKELSDLKLVCLTGVMVSEPTLAAVRDFIRKGGTCVALPHLAPKEFAGRSGEVRDGAGRWVLVPDFLCPEARATLAPFLSRPDEIRYRFGERVLTVRRQGEDGNAIRIWVEDVVAARSGGPPESARVW
jgi:hypothetical protein